MNKIFKILILIVYTFAIFAVAFIIVSFTNKGPSFNDYSDKASDENIAVVTQIIEKRKNTKQTKTDYEESVYDLYFYIKKKNAGTDLNDIYIYVAVETEDGIRYVQSSNGKDLEGSSTFTSSISITNSSAGEFAVNEVVEEDGTVKHINKIPKIVYIKVSYDKVVDKQDVACELNYKINYDDINKESFDDYEERKVIVDGSGKTQYIDCKKEFVSIKFLKIPFEASSGSVSYSDYRFTNLKIIESNLPENVSISNIKVEVTAETSNEDLLTKDYFSKYIKLFVYEGSLVSDINSSKTVSVADEYEIEKVYFNIEVELENGEVSNFKYFVSASELLAN